MGETTWDPSLETGDALVDEQHRSIHGLVADLERAGGEEVQILDVLSQLMEHVDEHFATEEALMERSGYANDEFLRHVAEHRELAAKARDLVLRFRAGEIPTIPALTSFLREWLVDHVDECDRPLVEHVKAGGQAAELPMTDINKASGPGGGAD